MRIASTDLAARISGGSTTLARLWRITRFDGNGDVIAVLRFTDAVRPVTIQIDPDDAPEVYRSDISFTASAIFTSTSFANQQSVTMTFLLDDAGLAEKDLRGRLYDGATSETFVVDYQFPQYGAINIYTGLFGTITLSDQHIGTVEVTPSQSTINGTGVGVDKYSQTCRASLGDAKCKVDMNTLKATFAITGFASATDGSFTATALNQENAHWALGFILWTGGQNAGQTSPVASSDQPSTSIFLTTPPFFPMAIGDTGTIYPGCDKLRQTCHDKFNNVVNLRAEPDVPTGAGTPGSNYNLSGFEPT